jgi:hypothetical protein
MKHAQYEFADEFVERAFELGASDELVELVRHNDELMKWWISELKREVERRFVHGVFTRQEEVLASFLAHCEAKGVDSTRFRWTGPQKPPDFDLSDPETVVVLDATLDTLLHTVQFAWDWAKKRIKCDGWWEADRGDVHGGLTPHLAETRLPDGIEFVPWTLSWRRIKLDANIGKSVISAYDSSRSPGCALLFAAAEHPHRITAIQLGRRRGFWVPGLYCPAAKPDEEDGNWYAMNVSFNETGQESMELWVDAATIVGDGGVPIFRD